MVDLKPLCISHLLHTPPNKLATEEGLDGERAKCPKRIFFANDSDMQKTNNCKEYNVLLDDGSDKNITRRRSRE